MAAALVVGLIVGSAAAYEVAAAGVANSVTVLTKTETATSTSTLIISSTQLLKNAYLNYLEDVDSRNASAIVSDYATNATMLYGGDAGLSTGGCTLLLGTSLIQDYFRFVLSQTEYAGTVTNASTPTVGEIGNFATVNGSFTLSGIAPGQTHPVQFDVRVALSLSFVYLGGSWLIDRESWTPYGADESFNRNC